MSSQSFGFFNNKANNNTANNNNKALGSSRALVHNWKQFFQHFPYILRKMANRNCKRLL